MPIFMKAGSIKGDVVAESHKNWIPIKGCSFDIAFDEDEVRKSLEEGAPEPKIEPFEVTKEPDECSPGLMQWMLDGNTLDEVQIDVCGDAIFKGSWRVHVRYVLKKCVLIDYSLKMTDGEKGDAEISLKLQFDSISMEQISYDVHNKIRTRSTATAHQRTS